MVAIIILFERIGQYDGAVSPILCAWRRSAVDSGLMANKNKSLASESDGDVFVGTNLRWVTLGGVFHLVPELNYLKKSVLAWVRNLKLF